MSDSRKGQSAPASACAIWGVLNVTPDSFSDGGLYVEPARALAHAQSLLEAGAEVVDVGGASSRPPGATYGSGAVPVDPEEEVRRVVPVIERLVVDLGARVSIDTTHPVVAAKALSAGASIVNDVSCGADPALMEVTARAGAELVLMHSRGRGEVTEANTRYGDLVTEVRDELLAAAARATERGVAADRIWLDPGLGFAKNAQQSARLLAETRTFVDTGYKVLVGPSRKSFLAVLAPRHDGATPEPTDRVGATAAAVTLAVLGGAHAVRVHDVAVMHQAVRFTLATARGRT